MKTVATNTIHSAELLAQRETLSLDALSALKIEFLTPKNLASFLGISRRSLSRWHALRVGPPRIKRGRLILYRKTAVEEWLRQAEIAPVRDIKSRKTNNSLGNDRRWKREGHNG